MEGNGGAAVCCMLALLNVPFVDLMVAVDLIDETDGRLLAPVEVTDGGRDRDEEFGEVGVLAPLERSAAVSLVLALFRAELVSSERGLVA